MLRNIKPLTATLIIVVFFLVLIISCEKEVSIELPTLTTLSVNEITETSAKSGGNITDDGGAQVNSRGLIWNTSSNLTLEEYYGMSSEGPAIGVYTSTMYGLTPDTEYFVRSYATNNIGTSYGDITSFRTKRGRPTVTTNNITDITAYFAKGGGNEAM